MRELHNLNSQESDIKWKFQIAHVHKTLKINVTSLQIKNRYIVILILPVNPCLTIKTCICYEVTFSMTAMISTKHAGVHPLASTSNMSAATFLTWGSWSVSIWHKWGSTTRLISTSCKKEKRD